MNKLSELKEKKKLDNKGFSLVELIIVIAIMAVLVGILAPTYLKYVEKSRQSADGTMVQEFIDALSVLGSDVDAASELTSNEYVVSVDAATGEIKYDALKSVPTFTTYIDTNKTYKLKSKMFTESGLTITLKYDKNVWTVIPKDVPGLDNKVSATS